MSNDNDARTATLGTDDLLPLDEVLPPGAIVGGRYEVRESLGSGGYAIVYRVWDRQLECEVALKLLRRDRGSANAFARFRREVNVAREAASPRLVRVYDLGASDGASYLTMEIVPGGSLRSLIRRGGAPIDEAVRVAMQMLEGLAALHALNVVHRDVKPENVLLDANGDAKLADFGLARYIDEEHSHATATGAIVGTSDYLSPEQARGEAVGPRADLYAAGAVLFELLTGEKPFRRESSVGSVLARLVADAPPVRSIRRDVPLWLSSIVARLLQRDPAARYASAQEVLAALRAKRADLRTAVPWRRVFVGAIGAAIIAALVVVPQLFAPPHESVVRFARVAMVDDDTIAAISSNGETLWRRTGVDAYGVRHAALVRLQPNARPLLAMVLMKRHAYRPADRQTLSFVDPDTGAVRKEVLLPSGADQFPMYANRYFVSGVNAVDLDRDGVDEVVVSYAHVPEAPSYVILYEPKIDRARIIFCGMGGHNFVSAQDLDGDGRPELLIMGINNNFDWINAMAAVRVRPWVGESWGEDLGTLYTPERTGWHDGDLLWYAPLPRGQKTDDLNAYGFDPATKRISIVYGDGRRVTLTRDGFRTDEPSPYAPAVRQAYRNAAYVQYRESTRLFAGGFTGDALHAAAGAVDNAQKASDAVLTEVMQRAQGKLLILAGKTNEGEALMRSIAATSENASEIAYDTAVAFHLRGDIDRAVEWYERGYGPGALPKFGKSKHEFIQGIVLALCERGEWSRAEEAVRRFDEVYLGDQHERNRMYLEFIHWRAGQLPNFNDIQVPPTEVDVHRYWQLEFRNRRGDDPAAILRSLDELIADGCDPRNGLWSLKAELLARLGKPNEAADAVRRAWAITKMDRKTSIMVRGHGPIVEERLKRLAGEAAR